MENVKTEAVCLSSSGLVITVLHDFANFEALENYTNENNLVILSVAGLNGWKIKC